jgi:thioredoxin
MKTIGELNDDNFDQAITTAPTPVVVDFYAPWCGPCKMLTPLLQTLAERFTGRVQFFKVNVDEAPALAERFQVTGVPMLVFFANGEPRDGLIGFPSPPVLAAKLHALTETKPAEARA